MGKLTREDVTGDNMNELNNKIEEIVFNFASNAAEWGQNNPDMDVNVERMMSREIAKDYTEDLVALITEQVRLGRIDELEKIHTHINRNLGNYHAYKNRLAQLKDGAENAKDN